jgi:protein SCO1/2
MVCVMNHNGLAARWAGAIALLSVASATAEPISSKLDPVAAMTTGERALGRTLGNYTLTDTRGVPFNLWDYRGKPLVVSLVYSACSSVCPVTTQHLIDAVTEAGRVFGFNRFAVLTLGFDARNDTVPKMAQFASVQGIKLPNWQVASADAATIEALLNDLGFSYRAVAGGFDHPTQTTIVDSDGKIYRHIYGDEFPLPMFMEPMKNAIYGTAAPFTWGGIIDRIKFICTAYDPGSRRYRTDFGLAFGAVIAAFSLFAMAGFILREWIRAARTRAT